MWLKLSLLSLVVEGPLATTLGYPLVLLFNDIYLYIFIYIVLVCVRACVVGWLVVLFLK